MNIERGKWSIASDKLNCLIHDICNDIHVIRCFLEEKNSIKAAINIDRMHRVLWDMIQNWENRDKSKDGCD